MIKITQAGRQLLGDCVCELPYEGAKPMFVLDCMDDKEFLAKIVKETCAVLPNPLPKKKKICNLPQNFLRYFCLCDKKIPILKKI